MSKEPIYLLNDGGDISGETMYNNLPNVTSPSQPFQVEYIQPANYSEFYNQVYEYRNVEPLTPYRYGSYQVYQANKNNNQYQVNNFVNTTSQDVAALYPQFIYTSILRTALDDPDFTMDVTTTPFPILYQFMAREQTAKTLDYVFMLSIALALIPCVVVSFILNERENQLKHQQLVSGMSMTGYWASNTISDIIYAYVPIVLIIMLNAAFGLDTDYGWLFLMLYPPAVIPFSYMTSFMFSDDTTAQICTLFVHFIGGGIFTVVVYVLQLVPDTAIVGDALRYVGLVIPSFCVTHAFINSNELS
jgi:ATP-binding cassette subfamily A (ABC1) protein 3